MNAFSVVFSIFLIVNVCELRLVKENVHSRSLKSNEITLENSRTKREVVGGVTECNPNDGQYMNLAEESLSKYMQDACLTENYRVFKVNKVTEQVVEGTLTTIEFVAGPCAEDGVVPTSDKCDVIDNNNVIECNSEVWDRPWMNSKTIEVWCA
ncbi:uncharacterized protein LOC116772887 [Danaus plexippus]|uniref:uncharacterized protein LOC116772887 n=1 Tax=Danaus plexippus TaxID=13037 RepID=UPI002AB31F1B|nr:uncharacterized protein LOC116772887 [Danaus plexippus]